MSYQLSVSYTAWAASPSEAAALLVRVTIPPEGFKFDHANLYAPGAPACAPTFAVEPLPTVAAPAAAAEPDVDAAAPDPVPAADPPVVAPAAARRGKVIEPQDAPDFGIDDDTIRATMRKLFDAGKKAEVQLAMKKLGGGALSVSSMTQASKAAFFTELNSLMESSNG